MDPKDDHVTIAWIYGLFFLLSAAVAFVLFYFLPSSADASGTLGGVKFKAGGAVAGFIASFLVLQFAYSRFASKPSELRVSGIVVDEQDHPVQGAKVSVDGQNLGDIGTHSNGFFEVRLESRPPWTLRARKEGYEVCVTEIDRKQAKTPVPIQLKKNSSKPRTQSGTPGFSAPG